MKLVVFMFMFSNRKIESLKLHEKKKELPNNGNLYYS